MKFEKSEELEFQDYHFNTSLPSIRTGILFGLVLYSLFGLLDNLSFPDSREIVLLIRYIIIVPFFILIYISTYYKIFRKIMNIVLSLTVIIPSFGIIAMMVISNSEEVGYHLYYVGIMVVILLGSTFFKLKLWNFVFSCLIILCIYGFAAIYFQNCLEGGIKGKDFPILLSNILFLFSIMIISSVITYMFELNLRKEFIQQKAIKEEKEKLKESEERNRILLENLGEGVTIIDLDEKCVFANPAAEILFGVEYKELVGYNLRDFLSEKNIQKIQEETENRKQGITSTYELEIIRPDGEKRFVLITATPHYDNFNRVKGTLGIFRDITERKQAEEELKREKNFSENIVATIPDSLLILDKNLKIKSANHTFYETFQMEPEKVIGSSITNILGNEDEKLSKELTKLFGTEDMLENFEIYYQSEKLDLFQEEGRLTSKSERIFNISARGMLFAEEEEEELVIMRDITERKNSEEELRKAYLQLEDTQQELIQSQTLVALGGFASGIAHEIRNPLANISASAQFCIKKFDLTGKIKSYLKIIIRNSNKANRIIKDLLDFARPSEFVFKQGNILQPLNRACDLTKAKRFNNNIRLYKRCSKALPKILMDEKRMEQVFLNIIINSIDAMNKGGRLLITAWPEKEYVVINISDTGIGIAKKDIDKIFNPFFTKKSDGVGLGLSVAHRIIQSHKGKIEVESKYNKGTKFIIRLPIINNKK